MAKNKVKPGKHEIHFTVQESYDRAYVNQVLADSGNHPPLPGEGQTVTFADIETHCKDCGVVARQQKTEARK